MPAIIVHGGAGNYDPGEPQEKGVTVAAQAGWRILSEGGSALDAMEAAVVSMEDDPIFRAGFGSALSLTGEVETDASVMLSDTSCGGVAALRVAANPIRAARLVMERTDHVLIVGAGADHLARKAGLPERDLRSPAQIELHEKLSARITEGDEVNYMPRLTGLIAELGLSGDADLGTVGAVAIDSEGRIAAGTSTGGMSMKLPGRVGDSAVIGAGTYANRYGGVSATGHGEPIMRQVISKVAVDAIATVGVREAIDLVLEIGRGHDFRFGIVGVEENEAVAFGFTTKAMAWASIAHGNLRTFMSE